MNVINDILDVSKIEANNMDVESLKVSLFDCVDEIESLIGGVIREKGIQFSINYNYPLPRMITTDPVRLKQVLLNLLSNAVKFTEQGTITMTTSFDQFSGKLKFSIEDTGIGMDENEQIKIFSAFSQADLSTTRKYGGSGLGLNISRKIVNLLGGDITVSDEFIASPDEIKRIKTPEKDSQNKKLSGNVLVVEDSPDIRDLVVDKIKILDQMLKLLKMVK